MKHLAITNDRHLQAILKIKEPQLKQVLDSVPTYYKPWIKEEIKKDGSIKRRPICPSVGILKLLQGRLRQNVFGKYRLPEYVQGGIKGKDSITNAKVHQGKNFHFCLDLKNFFPSVKSGRVNKVLLQLGYTPSVASTITKIVTATLKNEIVDLKWEIPQGSSTSTCVTNLVFYMEVDRFIEKLLKGKNIAYTRYVDDLNFSAQFDFEPLVYEIVRIIAKANFKINRKKTFYKRGKVEITGTQVCQNALKPTEKLKEKAIETNRSEASKKGVLKHIERIRKA